MKHKVLVICLFLLIGCGFDNAPEKCKPTAVYYRLEFERAFFNSDNSFSFEIKTGLNMTAIKICQFRDPPPIIYDVTGIESNYFIAKRKKTSWNPPYLYYDAEIHLKKKSDLSPGTEDRGKFGMHPWNEIK